jgi:hypothetical protein
MGIWQLLVIVVLHASGSLSAFYSNTDPVSLWLWFGGFSVTTLITTVRNMRRRRLPIGLKDVCTSAMDR